ncbi:thrombospondin type 3 repeat-containing protein [Nannocystis sp. ILAH1]|uniref:thrombospondin type 3 repeat-containing protein n=1 Tax=unclassified Nannocystis TaxID=2627009 RepID=UPI002270A155|nr:MULTISPECIES: thrombospondin type 3 repeat-containing protein [unclassified Nannocystis]MCY0992044.1 thrombospondin type 3 repeat-containing protein [Nannocystis sp. ILAH1]MCY1064292.1 thrombospondin type 3 repeat-containing protein [Nannocystis sp. RBIL2]
MRPGLWSVILMMAACTTNAGLGDETATKTTSASDTTSTSDPEPTGGGAPLTLHGVAQKGPFVLGASISVSPLTNAGQPTGQQFEVPTSNDGGEFSVDGVPLGPVALLANGYHYDEIRGGPSMAPLTLRALHRVSGEATTVNIHVLSHLSEQRARMLIAEQVTVEDALALADAEVVAALGIGKPGFALAGAAAEASVLGPDTDDNAYLFAVSAVVMQAAYMADPEAADAAVQTLLNQLAADLAGDGTLDDGALRGRLEAAETALEAKPVRAALANYMAGLGLPGTPPDYARILDQDHDGLANSEDNCPLVANLDQVDADGDDRGDVCDACPNSGVDMDGDGYDDGCDNCPAVANADPPQAPSQFDPLSDIDEDGLGNACDFCPNSKGPGADPDDVCCDPRVGGCIEDNGAPSLGCLPEGASFACKEALGGCGPYEQCYCEDLVCMKAGAIRSDPECYHDGCRCDEFRCIAEWCTVGETVCKFGNTCVPYYGPGEAPEPAVENLGLCLDADSGPCVGKTALECLDW